MIQRTKYLLSNIIYFERHCPDTDKHRTNCCIWTTKWSVITDKRLSSESILCHESAVRKPPVSLRAVHINTQTDDRRHARTSITVCPTTDNHFHFSIIHHFHVLAVSDVRLHTLRRPHRLANLLSVR